MCALSVEFKIHVQNMCVSTMTKINRIEKNNRSPINVILDEIRTNVMQDLSFVEKLSVAKI